MVSREGFQELVILFDHTGSKIDLEMRLGQFSGLLAQKGTLGSHAGSAVKAAYAQVGANLTVHALVFFQFKVNEQGYLDPAFNLPLEYMAEHAGEGPDLGDGQSRMACRSQCPVPWHAINMWEPAGEGDDHPAMLVQKAVWRNRLGLKLVAPGRKKKVAGVREDGARATARRSVEASANERADERADEPAPEQPPEAVRDTLDETEPVGLDQVANGSANGSKNGSPNGSAKGPKNGSKNGSPNGSKNGSSTVSTTVARMQAMERKLTAAFGEAGRVDVSQYTRQHREQLGQVATQFRSEMARQQQGYLDQIKSCREEIQHLKAALRHEQKRNQRLQQLLRGDV